MKTPDTGTAATTEPATTPVDVDRLVRWSTIAVVILVAGAAAYVSYRHAYELIHTHGESGAAAIAGPLTVDGLIYASGMVLLQAARYRQRASWLAYAGLWLGIVATIGANVVHGVSHGPIGALVSAWPAVALIVCYELLMKIIRVGAERGTDPGRGHDAASDDRCPHEVAGTAEDSVVTWYLHSRDCLGEELSQRRLAAAFGVDRKKVAELVRPHTSRDEQPPTVPVDEAAQESA